MKGEKCGHVQGVDCFHGMGTRIGTFGKPLIVIVSSPTIQYLNSVRSLTGKCLPDKTCW